MRRIALSSQLIFSVVIIQMIMLSILVWNSVRLISDSHADLLQQTAKEEVSLMANTVAPGLMANDVAMINDALNLIKNNRQLHYIVISNVFKEVLSSYGNHPKIITQDKSYTEALSDGVYDITQPIDIYNQRLGYIQVGYSIEVIKNLIDDTTQQNTLIALLTLLLSIIVTVLIGLVLTRGLRRLEKGALAFGQGDLDYRIKTGRNDEIGDVITSFNQMADRRKHAEDALALERDYATAIIETSPVIIMLMNREGKIEHVNHYFEELSGYTLNEIVGKDWFETFLPERDRETIRQVFKSSWGEQHARGYINPITRRDGLEIDIEWYDTLFSSSQFDDDLLLVIGQDVTERVAFKNNLINTQNRLYEAQHIARMGNWELDLINDDIFWSNEMYSIFEFDLKNDQPSYELYIESIHPEDRNLVNKQINAAYKKSLASNEPYELTHRLLMKDGRIKFVREHYEITFDDNNHPVKARGTIQDITQLTINEIALQKSQTNFDTLARNAPVAIFQTDAKGLCSYMSDRWFKLTGLDVNSAMDEGWNEVLFEDDRPFVYRSWMKAVQTKQSFSQEFRVQHINGKLTWVYTQADIVYDESGEFLNYVGTITDIDDRKKTELANIETRKRMRKQQRAMLLFAQRQKKPSEDINSLYRHICESIAAQLEIERASIWLFNDKHDELTCMCLYHLSTKKVEDGITLHQKDYPEYFSAMNSNRVISASDANTHPDTSNFSEHYLPINNIQSILDAPLRDGHGNVIGVLCLESVGAQREWFSDEENFISSIADMLSLSVEINARKKTEAELKTYQDGLEQMVKQRTTELESINNELESFTYSVSHDLRAPLRGIDGFSKILLDKYSNLLDSEGKNHLNRVRTGAQRMGMLINDLLEMSRACQKEISLEQTNLSQICENAINELKQIEPDRQLDINISPDLTLISDVKVLTIIMNNLIGNAWKFSSKNNLTRIEVGCNSISGSMVYHVSDNGCGFDSRYSDKLFHVFQRLHTEDDFPGTGIGLSTVFRLLKKLNGRIWAESELNKGSTFYFTFDNSGKK